MPTSSAYGTVKGWLPRRISSRIPGAILQPQPPPWARDVSDGSLIAGLDCVLLSVLDMGTILLKMTGHRHGAAPFKRWHLAVIIATWWEKKREETCEITSRLLDLTAGHKVKNEGAN